MIKSTQLDIESLYEALGIENLKKRTINFYFDSIKNGNIGPIIKFPNSGIISKIEAFCKTAPDELVKIDIEKVREVDLPSNLWASIYTDENLLSILKDNLAAEENLKFNNIVTKNDYFRVNFIKPDENINSTLKDLTIQIEIEIQKGVMA